jgi:photosystem II stability/assembly factor-like uncharacterized protein
MQSFIFLLLSISFLISCNQLNDYPIHQHGEKTTVEKEKQPIGSGILFQSTDQGKTWQDISKGLPSNLEPNDFIANESGLYIPNGVNMFHGKLENKDLIWNKETFLQDVGDIQKCRSGMYAIRNGNILQKVATNTWLPVFTNFKKSFARSIFESASGSILLGCDNGIFKSMDRGISWKQVIDGGWVIKMIESSGVMLATSQSGIIRSTDEGEHWEMVISEGGVGIDVASLQGGFAAITYNTESKTRRVRTSYDNGKTWQAIDAGLPPHDLIANVIQEGDNIFCGHPNGIYRSSDKGKNWEIVLPSLGKKVFNIVAHNGVIYALPKNGGC